MYRRFGKRIIDTILAAGGIVVFAIPMLIIGICIKVDSKGPIIFKQSRLGKNKQPFKVMKFRTMCDHAYEKGGIAKKSDDPRITNVGAFLRRTSLDELPQFWNVFKGDMSVVGPRPHMVKQTDEYSSLIPKYMVRHFAKPGITGWAQVTGFRGETSELWQMEGRVKKDIWYIEHWTIWLDIKIMWLTVKNVFVGDKNAY